MSVVAGDDRVDLVDSEVLASDWAVLTKYTIRYRRADGTVQTLSREAYDRGDGAAVLPYDPDRGTVLLGRQFRLVAWLNGEAGDLVEVAAGKLDDTDPLSCAKAETEEELGLVLRDMEKLWEVYMSPGSVTERLHFYVGRYSADDRRAETGGLAHEGEEIEVLELPIAEALDSIASGGIRDAKTIMLLQHAALHLFPNAAGGSRP